MSTSITNLLKNFGLRNTESRHDILAAFQTNKAALSHSDLEQLLGSGLDRVTIYRTLHTFLEKGILHKVLDDEGGTKYALCPSACSHNHHHHDHVHFKCQQCSQTTCIESVHIPPIALPKGYQRVEVNLLVQGLCPNCSA